MIFNPANFILLRFDLEETAAMLEHLKRLPVDHFSDAIGNGGHAIVKVHLSS
jgi:hypothetical protein